MTWYKLRTQTWNYLYSWLDRLRLLVKRRKRILTLLLLYLVSFGTLLVWALPGVVQADELQGLRVGYVREPGYFYKDDFGEYQGYTIDLLFNVASRGKFTLQVVEFDNYEDEDQALREGRIDIETILGYSEARARQFLYSETVTANIPLTVMVRKDDLRYRFGDFKAVNGMRVGLVRNDATGDIFEEWCRKSQLQPETVFYPDNEAQLAAFKSGQVDGIINGTDYVDESRILLYYGHIPCYAIFNKQRGDLKLQFDTALRHTLADNPQLLEHLHSEHLPVNMSNLDLATPEETKLSELHPDVTVAVQEYDPPYVYLDTDGKLRGIIPDYYKQLGLETGLKFKYRVFPTAATAMAAVRQGKAQVLGLYSGSQAFAYRERLRLIAIAGTGSLLRIDHYENQGGHKAAVVARTLSLLKQRLTGQNYELEPYPDIEACYDALLAGKVDCLLCEDTMSNWLFNNHRMEGYSMIPLGLSQKIYTAVSYNAEDALYGLLSKGAIKVAANYNGLVTANVKPRNSLKGVLSRLPFWGLATFTGVMVALVLLLGVLMVVLRRRYQEKTKLAARTAENEKEKIRLEALEKNAEEKNQFFASISHDLRTPLNAILGFSILARDSGREDQVRVYLQKIYNAGQLMLDLVNDTLTMSKLKSGKLELKQELLPRDPRELFQPVFDTVMETAAAKNIQLTVSLKDEMNCRVTGDRLNLRKIVLNLLTNAVKYTPAGGHIKVNFWSEVATDKRWYFLISVEDDGIGIAPEFQDHVFEPFCQEKRQGYESSGTGLGLAIVKQLVNLMGGSITLKSVQNQGSCFTVRLQLPEALASQIDAGTSARQAAPVAAKKLAGCQVLLCEDNAMNREITCALLKSQGMLTVTAENGRLGVECFAASVPGTFAAILMDLRMPEMDGYEATRQIRSLPRPDAASIPIIALTAETFAEDMEKCRQAGMNDHVAKPLVPKILFASLARFIKS